MKNLKRVLSLVLALMMALSLMAFSSSASAADSTTTVASEFDDYGDVSDAYKEAANVVVALGIIQGKDSGLDPAGNLTRAEAVILIERVLLGDAVVESLSGSTSSIFTDVGTSFPYGDLITYAANTGIVSGDASSKQFFPSDELNTVSFGKILLGALGYDTDKQGYTGSMWHISVFRDMAAAGISLDGVGMFDNLTREQAMQMVFQTLQADMVTYAAGSNTPTPVANDGSSDYAGRTVSGSENKVTQFCERYCSNLKLSTGTDSDAFGRPAAVWKLNGTEISKSADTSTASTTYTSKQKLTSVTFYNGSAPVYQNSKDSSSNITNASGLNALTGNGVLVEVYKNENGEIKQVVVIDTALMKISRIASTSVTLSYVDGYNFGALTVDNKNSNFSKLSGMAVGDYVLVTAADKAVQTVAVPDVVSGTVSAKSTGQSASITVGGQRYSIAEKANVDNVTVSATSEYKLFLDAYGYVIHGELVEGAAEANVKAVFVASSYLGLNDFGAANSPMFQGVLTDGTIITGQHDGETVDTDGSEDGQACAYDITNGIYTLTAAAADSSVVEKTGSTLDADAIKVDSGDYFIANVPFIYVNDKQANIEVEVRYGVQAISNTSTLYYLVIDKENHQVVAVFVKGQPENTITGESVIYVAKNSTSTSSSLGKDGTTKVWEHTVYINGVQEKITSTDTTISAGFYTYTVSEKTGAYALTNIETADEKVNGVASNVTINVGEVVAVGTGYRITTSSPKFGTNNKDLDLFDATGAQVVDVAGGSISSIEDLKETADRNSVTVDLVVSTENMTVTAIYITSKVTESAAPSKPATGGPAPITTVESGEVKTYTTSVETTVNVEGGAQLNLDAGAAASADITVADGAKLVVSGTIAKDAQITVADGGSLVINGTIAAGAQITVSNLNDVALGDNANITDGSIKDAVKLDSSVALSKTEVQKVGVGVPVYAETAPQTDDWGIQPNTVAVKWQTEVGTKVVQTISDGYRTYTVTGEVAGAGGNITMFDLHNPYYQEASGISGAWTGTGEYTDFANANAGETLTIKVVTAPEDSSAPVTLVNFSMPNPVKSVS